MYPDLATKLIFNQKIIVELISDYEDSVMISVYNHSDETDFQHRTFTLEPDEIDLFIATLTLYKNRITSGRKKRGVA